MKTSCSMGLCVALMLYATVPDAQAGKGGGKPPPPPAINTHSIQQPPIKLGTSGGWAPDLANGYCCGGTLGSLVCDGTGQYILSNFHVFAGDQVAGGNGTVATLGDPIIQPGLIDVGCNAAAAQTVASLDAYADPLQGANIDAALARVVPGMVDPSGAILGIGTLSAATVAPAVNMAVKKCGRTTGLTSSRISALNATIRVAYDTECAGTARGTATFTGQIVIANKGNKFLNAGDSGSLLVENVSANPRAVGLLFAGSSTTAIANPISDVLNTFGVQMVGVASGAAAATADTSASPAHAKAMAAQKRMAARIEALPNVVGHGIGAGLGDSPVIKVFVEKDAESVRRALPAVVDGHPIVVEEVGLIVAF